MFGNNEIDTFGDKVKFVIDRHNITCEDITTLALKCGLSEDDTVDIICRCTNNGKEWSEIVAEIKADEFAKENLLSESALGRLDNFLKEIEDSVYAQPIPTGFKDIDTFLDGGLYPGLITLGAIPSLGKSTLAIHIADNVAKSGIPVYIFALEMSASEIMGKIISRKTFEISRGQRKGNQLAKTYREIVNGKLHANYSIEEKQTIKSAIEDFKTYASNLYIHEGVGNIGVEYIRRAVDHFVRKTGQRPLVIVDYIQILAPYDVRATEKQNIDKAVLELKRISRDYKLPVISVSAFNRASYKTAVSFEAFKESGALEYGSDIMFGLQFDKQGEEVIDPDVAKKQPVRELEIKVLKNRNGQTGNCHKMEYTAKYNHFEEVGTWI